MSHRTPRDTRSGPVRQRGQALVEAAAGISILLLFVLIIVDFSPIISRGSQLTQAAREGAGFGSGAPSSTSVIRQRVAASVPALALDPTSVTAIRVTCNSGLNGASLNCASAWAGDTITVEVTYLFSPQTRVITAITGDPITITRSATTEIY